MQVVKGQGGPASACSRVQVDGKAQQPTEVNSTRGPTSACAAVKRVDTGEDAGTDEVNPRKDWGGQRSAVRAQCELSYGTYIATVPGTGEHRGSVIATASTRARVEPVTDVSDVWKAGGPRGRFCFRRRRNLPTASPAGSL